MDNKRIWGLILLAIVLFPGLSSCVAPLNTTPRPCNTSSPSTSSPSPSATAHNTEMKTNSFPFPSSRDTHQSSFGMEQDISPSPSYCPSPSENEEPLLSPDPPSTSFAIDEPTDSDLVLVKDYLPSVVIDLRYATENNFTGTVIYENLDCYLRYGTVKKLIAAAEELEKKGYFLKIYDAYRPTWAQFKLWEICPDPAFVSNPYVGFSSHSKGNTIDVTLVDIDGNELLMPSTFDDFSSKANRDYSDASEEQRKNVLLLEETLYSRGFKGYSKEWWHYTDLTDYPIVND